jgi:Flp pilus assembly protein TadB
VTAVLVAGGLVGVGLYLFIRSLVPVRPGIAAALGELDAARMRAGAPVAANPARRAQLSLGAAIREAALERGIKFTSLRQDLALLGRSLEAFLATKVLLGLAGLVSPIIGTALIATLGMRLGLIVPLWASVLLAAGGFFLPDLLLRTEAADRRRDFRHVVGSFLDLVAMNLAGGRGVPEALLSAASISDGWAMVRIRETLTDARLHGVTPWAALGDLGDLLAIDELRDLAAALALVAEDGAKVRASLSARAESMRRRDLADSEGKAQERSQSMLVAQLLLCAGFLLFLTYPAVVRVLLS